MRVTHAHTINITELIDQNSPIDFKQKIIWHQFTSLVAFLFLIRLAGVHVRVSESHRFLFHTVYISTFYLVLSFPSLHLNTKS